MRQIGFRQQRFGSPEASKSPCFDVMITSRLATAAQTTIPPSVRPAVGLRKGDELATIEASMADWLGTLPEVDRIQVDVRLHDVIPQPP